MDFQTLFIYFFSYSMLGWVCEVIYCSLPAKQFVNRGMLHGPYCPIYGFGALGVLFFLTPFRQNPILVYFAGILITSILEYFTSYILEKVFHTSFWDYSDHRFHLHGRVCLLNSILFGVLSLALMYLIHPFLQHVVGSFSLEVRSVIFTFGMVILAIDGTSTYHALTALRESLKHLDELGKEISEKLSSLSEEGLEYFSQLHLDIKSRKESFASHLNFGSRRLLSAFPKLRSLDFEENIIFLREAMAKQKEKLKVGRKK